MIRTIAELLDELAKAEAKRLAAQSITHPGVIGEMYEGLTKEIVGRSIPARLNLQVVDGFVTDGHGHLSGQIDLMIVRGVGELIPYTGSYKWHVRDVLAVFEVKKTLFGAELSDAYDQLWSVSDTFSRYLRVGDDPINLQPTLQAYSQIMGEIAPPPGRWSELPNEKHLIIYSLMFDQLAPIRVMFGYGGYRSEAGLRKGFLDYLEKQGTAFGYGVPSFPNLITVNGSSLLKGTGHPYVALLDENGHWPVLASTTVNPLLLLLELLWTRISYTEPMPELFGEDLLLEKFKRLLVAIPMQRPDDPTRWGWMYNSIEAKQSILERLPHTAPWEPTTLTPAEYAVVQHLCLEEAISLNDPRLIAIAQSIGQPVHDLACSLVSTTLVARDGDHLRLTTTECATAKLPDGRCIAAENNTGRLSRWIERYNAARRSLDPSS